MNEVAAEVLMVLMRWMHISSVVLLIGSAAFIRMIARAALFAAPEPDRDALVERIAAGFRTLAWAGMVGILGSGLFNLISRPGHTRFYHMVFGIKMLVAAHVFVTAILTGRAGATEGKFYRRAAGVLYSGLAAILISAYLRRIF